jgi:hypothetical protein
MPGLAFAISLRVNCPSSHHNNNPYVLHFLLTNGLTEGQAPTVGQARASTGAITISATYLSKKRAVGEADLGAGDAEAKKEKRGRKAKLETDKTSLADAGRDGNGPTVPCLAAAGANEPDAPVLFAARDSGAVKPAKGTVASQPSKRARSAVGKVEAAVAAAPAAAIQFGKDAKGDGPAHDAALNDSAPTTEDPMAASSGAAAAPPIRNDPTLLHSAGDLATARAALIPRNRNDREELPEDVAAKANHAGAAALLDETPLVDACRDNDAPRAEQALAAGSKPDKTAVNPVTGVGASDATQPELSKRNNFIHLQRSKGFKEVPRGEGRVAQPWAVLSNIQAATTNQIPFDAVEEAEPLSRKRARNAAGETPRDVAVAHGKTQAAALLAVDEDAAAASPLVDAARAGDAAAVARLLKEGRSPNEADGSAVTALMAAAASGTLEAVNALLGAGAVARASDPRGRTALHMACAKGHSQVAEALLKAGADPLAKDAEDDGPAHDAALNGSAPTVEALLAASSGAAAAPIRASRDKNGKTPRDVALGAGNEDAAALLAEPAAAEAKVTASSASDKSVAASSPTPPLVVAAKAGYVVTARKLLDEGVDANATDKDGRTAPHHAAALPADTRAALLLSRGANANARDESGRTLLRAAALVKAGARNDVGDAEGATPPHCAGALGDLATARAALGPENSVSAILATCTSCGDPVAAERAVSLGAPVNEASAETDRTALMVTAEAGMLPTASATDHSMAADLMAVTTTTATTTTTTTSSATTTTTTTTTLQPGDTKGEQDARKGSPPEAVEPPRGPPKNSELSPVQAMRKLGSELAELTLSMAIVDPRVAAAPFRKALHDALVSRRHGRLGSRPVEVMPKRVHPADAAILKRLHKVVRQFDNTAKARVTALFESDLADVPSVAVPDGGSKVVVDALLAALAAVSAASGDDPPLVKFLALSNSECRTRLGEAPLSSAVLDTSQLSDLEIIRMIPRYTKIHYV